MVSSEPENPINSANACDETGEGFTTGPKALQVPLSESQEAKLTSNEGNDTQATTSDRGKVWNWFRSNHEIVNALTSVMNFIAAVIVGLAGLYVANEVRYITKYQADIAKREQLPTFSLQIVENYDAKDSLISEDLLVYNTGKPVQHFRCEMVSLLIAAGPKKFAGETLNSGVVFPIQDWFSPHSPASSLKDVIYIASSIKASSLDTQSILINNSPPGKGFNTWNYRGTQHLVRLRYTNIFDEPSDEFYLVNKNDFKQLDQKRGLAFYDGIKQLNGSSFSFKKALDQNFGDIVSKRNELSDVAETIPALKCIIYADETLSRGFFAY